MFPSYFPPISVLADLLKVPYVHCWGVHSQAAFWVTLPTLQGSYWEKSSFKHIMTYSQNKPFWSETLHLFVVTCSIRQTWQEGKVMQRGGTFRYCWAGQSLSVVAAHFLLSLGTGIRETPRAGVNRTPPNHNDLGRQTDSTPPKSKALHTAPCIEHNFQRVFGSVRTDDQQPSSFSKPAAPPPPPHPYPPSLHPPHVTKARTDSSTSTGENSSTPGTTYTGTFDITVSFCELIERGHALIITIAMNELADPVDN